MPYLVLCLTIKTTETIIKDNDILLRIYRSRERLDDSVSAGGV
jgi:hypothetical protein